MKKIFVGDISSYLIELAKKFDANTQLVTEDNFQSIDDGTYIISLGDFCSLKSFADALDLADELIYSPPDKWSDFKNNFSYMKYWTEFYMLYFKNKKHVHGIDHLTSESVKKINLILELSSKRKTDSVQIWNAGCSISHGTGVDDKERYGQLIADKLNLPISFLTADGSSIEWAADQILRSDIRENDIVIWGITTTNRFPYYNNNKLIHILTRYYETHPEINNIFNTELLSSDHCLYHALTKIHQVINFCKKIKAKLLLVGLLISVDDIIYFNDIQNYIHLHNRIGMNVNNMFIDFGTDNLHPGPKHHQWYAKEILNSLKLLT